MRKSKRKPTPKPASNQCTDQMKRDSLEKPVDNSPIVAHQPSTTSSISKSSSSSAIAHQEVNTLPSPELSPLPPTTESACESPDLTKCLDVEYEDHECVPGVNYTTLDGKEGWTPVIKKRRRTARVNRSSESESDESANEIDVSCSRLVKYEKREGIPGLKICCRRPATWTPITIYLKYAVRKMFELCLLAIQVWIFI